jgi:hypothetical protein
MSATTGEMADHPNHSHDNLLAWAWFCVWAAVGAAIAVGIVSLGPLALAPAVLASLIMFSRRTIRRSAFGLLSGAGIVLLIVAWVHRAGPGTTCWHTATSSGCDQHLNPIPWLILGIVLLVTGVLAHRARER